MLKKNYADKYRVTFRQGFDFLESFELGLSIFYSSDDPRDDGSDNFFHFVLIYHLRIGIGFLF
jgi:hypothetical protein